MKDHTLSITKDQIKTWRQGADDTAVANMAYKMDPAFRARVDQMKAREAEMDPVILKRLPTLLLNKQYFGDWELEPQDDITATMAQRATKPQPGIFSKAWDYATAPIDAAVGGIQKGIAAGAGALGMEGLKQTAEATPEAQGLRENLTQTGEIAPLVGSVIGSAAGPVGAGAGAFAGQGVKQLIDSSLGQQELSIPQQITEPIKQGAIAGTLDYGVGKVAGLATKAAAKVADKLPGRLVNSLIKPINNEFKFGKNPGEAIAREGIVASSADDLAAKVASKADEIGSSIQDKILTASAKSPKQIDLLPAITKPIDEALATAKKLPKTNKELISKLTGLRSDLVTRYGQTHAPIGVWHAKQDVGSLINWTKGDPFDELKNKALWKVFEGLKTQLNDAVPGLAPLNSRYSELVAAKSSIARRVINTERSNLMGLSPTIMGVGAGGAELIRSGDPGSALGAAVGGAALSKAGGSTLAKTAGAKAAATIPPAIAKAVQGLAPAVKAALFQMLSSEMSPEPE